MTTDRQWHSKQLHPRQLAEKYYRSLSRFCSVTKFPFSNETQRNFSINFSFRMKKCIAVEFLLSLQNTLK